ncbi:Energy-coupling factor transporter transmembrane protein EcfT [Moorella thermoacetica]|uniref:Energy-coupling factor transporter transmembrane protein EcfT n=1 Tax=Neomoorella thermoacetica TaxID=1525 RepID=A0AAC9HJF1_NEOTH|nr:energy-coupling factor transporter transmembrane component T [Moorella thermoacetica]AOQ24186.1 Energy-coupling factor transporter transmembrane protein EcfT [Moorella thermoacetica]TYL14593.1 Energy-coupling factor transporter transmembrane protein EcfT [Moorella thermoacetica]
MFERFFYQEKGLFLQSLHPMAAISYLGGLLVLALLFTNPLYLLGLLLVILLCINAVQGWAIWEIYFRLSLTIMVLVIIINPLVVRAGETIIWWGPRLPVFGRLTVSLEAICYGAAMSVRLLAIISVFCLYNLMVHPDKVLSVLARFASRSALVLSLATRMFPAMIRQLENIREVQAVRGVDFHAGKLRERLPRYAALMNILLLSSLEDSLEIAEAMQARAFGSGLRSCYRQDTWRPRDSLCLGGSLLALAAAVFGQVKGFSTFSFYPQLGYLIQGPMTVVVLIIILLALSVPVVLSWGWQRCPYFKAKI